ncbi:hypothetical protein [Desulforhabdus sp. TSK]|jgi:hypothetical protein|uniref:hypothetical protein n=1 Tax=Desulforhabdus sp. TSK TaxID=2925014 RepID=UPI001FC84D3F|nr:hypothetical protein [Desulforhabdus sp. TSK]GKT10999.1 hypothetical protein DSTSK_43040 [Desulforhabdus sp. TSK]
MRERIRCAHCSYLFSPNPRVKHQRYCSKTECQRARKRLWQKEKLARDPDYKLDHHDSNAQWRSLHPEYWKLYRLTHPDYTSRNRELQRGRDRVRLAKMDVLEPQPIVLKGAYYLMPETADLAKMDASALKVHLIPIT